MKAKSTIGRVSSHFAIFNLIIVAMGYFFTQRILNQPEAIKVFPHFPPLFEMVGLGLSIIGGLMALTALIFQKDRTGQVILSLIAHLAVFIGFYYFYILN